jgi:CRP-like cAMP-binding protein
MVRVISTEPLRNRLLAGLSSAYYKRLLSQLELVPLLLNQPIYDAGGVIDYAYFPTQGVISAVATMNNWTAIEIGTIGNEGMTGLPVLIETKTSPSRLYVQVAGSAARMAVGVLRRETRDGPLRKMAQLYQGVFLAQISQSVACNGLHTIQQRCCRWLLITHDRMHENILPLTHDLLAIMLGVRRAGVTRVLQGLHERGYLDYSRGKIDVLNRKGLEATACECYQSVKMQYEKALG